MSLGIPGLGGATEIGVGRSAVVYRARRVAGEEDGGQDVIVKVLQRTDDAFVERIDRISSTLLNLSRSPGIPTIAEIGTTEGGQRYLVVERYGPSLADRIEERGPIEWPEACSIMVGVAEAVADAHLVGLGHGNLTPASIVRSGGRYKVTDFGLAPRGDPPERPDPVDDVYALGVALARITGAPSGRDHPTDDRIPAPVRAVIDRATDPDPARRPSAAAVHKQLANLGSTTAVAPAVTDVRAVSSGGPLPWPRIVEVAIERAPGFDDAAGIGALGHDLVALGQAGPVPVSEAVEIPRDWPRSLRALLADMVTPTPEQRPTQVQVVERLRRLQDDVAGARAAPVPIARFGPAPSRGGRLRGFLVDAEARLRRPVRFALSLLAVGLVVIAIYLFFFADGSSTSTSVGTGDSRLSSAVVGYSLVPPSG